MTIIDRGAPLDDPEMVSLLAHEFVHAQQDYEVDLSIFGDTLPPGLDSFLARRAMIEGEAVLYQTMMAVRLAGNAVHEVEWHSWIHDWQAASREGMVTDHFPVTMSAGYFPYPFGVGVMYDAWVYDGPHEVRRVRDSLMVSTRQVVAGFGGTELFDGPWTEDLTDIEVPQLGAEYEFVLLDTLGSFVIEAFAARAGCEDVSVESLRGDTFAAAVHNPTDNVVASMRLSIADNAAQTGWRGCLAGAGDWNLRMDSGDITLIASEDPAVLETLEGVEWGPAPFRANR
ncbi:MAG: hypothetical protein GY946_00145 [bacterium]|nr:hypothetical protein [bacterium]